MRSKTLEMALAGLLVLPFLVAAANVSEGNGAKGSGKAGDGPAGPVAVAAAEIRGVEAAQWANAKGSWRQGNLNAQFASYTEDQAVPYRLVFEATTAGYVDVTITYARAVGNESRQVNGFSHLSAPAGVDPCADLGVTCTPQGESAFVVGGATLSEGASGRAILNNGVDETRQVRLDVAAPGTVVLSWAGHLAPAGPGPDGVTVLPGAGSVAGASLHVNVGVGGGGRRPLQIDPDAIAVLEPAPAPAPEPIVEPCTGDLTVAVVAADGASIPGASVTIADEAAEVGTSTLDCGDVAVALTALPEGYELADTTASLPVERTIAVDAAGSTTTFVLARAPAHIVPAPAPAPIAPAPAPIVPAPAPAPIAPAPAPDPVVEPCTGDLTVEVREIEGAPVPGAIVAIAGEEIVLEARARRSLDCGDVTVELLDLPAGYELVSAIDGGDVSAAAVGNSVPAAPDVVLAWRTARVRADSPSLIVFEIERSPAPTPLAPGTSVEEDRSETPTSDATTAPAPQPAATTDVSGDGQERSPLAAPVPTEAVQAPPSVAEPAPTAAPTSEATLDEAEVLPVTGADGPSLVVLGALLLLAGTLVAGGQRRERVGA